MGRIQRRSNAAGLSPRADRSAAVSSHPERSQIFFAGGLSGLLGEQGSGANRRWSRGRDNSPSGIIRNLSLAPESTHRRAFRAGTLKPIATTVRGRRPNRKDRSGVLGSHRVAQLVPEAGGLGHGNMAVLETLRRFDRIAAPTHFTSLEAVRRATARHRSA